MHVPLEHRWPTLQGPPLPQRHWPLVHRSVSTELQATQAFPEEPQAVVLVPARQAPDAQQPEAHVDELQP